MTRNELTEIGYVYVGKLGDGNELWMWRDEHIIYDPQTEEIVWRETDDISPKRRTNEKK